MPLPTELTAKIVEYARPEYPYTEQLKEMMHHGFFQKRSGYNGGPICCLECDTVVGHCPEPWCKTCSLRQRRYLKVNQT